MTDKILNIRRWVRFNGRYFNPLRYLSVPLRAIGWAWRGRDAKDWCGYNFYTEPRVCFGLAWGEAFSYFGSGWSLMKVRVNSFNKCND